MNTELMWAILQTLAYADVFSYPLTRREIYEYLISFRRYSQKSVDNALAELAILKLVYSVGKDKQFFSLTPSGFVDRQWRRSVSTRKIKRVKPVLKQIFRLPFVELIGVSGTVARSSATVHDDIDIFIITKAYTVWLTRLIITLYLDWLGLRRRPHDRRVANKLCVNMLVDTHHLGVPYHERDLFSAYEILQMRPIFATAAVYQIFFWENRWVKEFLGNVRVLNPQSKRTHSKDRAFFSFFLRPLESLAGTLQRYYMRRNKTTEYIADGYLRFHPQDARTWILRRYRWRLADLKRRLQASKTSRVSHLRLFEDAPEAPVPRD